MKKLTLILVAVFLVLLVGSAFMIYQALKPRPPQVNENTTPVITILPDADASIEVSLVKSATEDNSVDMTIQGMKNIASLEYELSYDTEGQIQGVNSGRTPIDVAGKSTFSRSVYLGTQSSGKKTPHKGVSRISLVVKFTDANGNKSQRSTDFSLAEQK